MSSDPRSISTGIVNGVFIIVINGLLIVVGCCSADAHSVMERLRDFNEKNRNGFISAVTGAALRTRRFQRVVSAGSHYCFFMRLRPRLRAGSDAYPGRAS